MKRICRNCTSCFNRTDPFTKQPEGICQNPESPHFLNWVSLDDTCKAFERPRSKFEITAIKITGSACSPVSWRSEKLNSTRIMMMGNSGRHGLSSPVRRLIATCTTWCSQTLITT